MDLGVLYHRSNDVRIFNLGELGRLLWVVQRGQSRNELSLCQGLEVCRLATCLCLGIRLLVVGSPLGVDLSPFLLCEFVGLRRRPVMFADARSLLHELDASTFPVIK